MALFDQAEIHSAAPIGYYVSAGSEPPMLHKNELSARYRAESGAEMISSKVKVLFREQTLTDHRRGYSELSSDGHRPGLKTVL